jgi:hypothetical protein
MWFDSSPLESYFQMEFNNIEVIYSQSEFKRTSLLLGYCFIIMLENQI